MQGYYEAVAAQDFITAVGTLNQLIQIAEEHGQAGQAESLRVQLEQLQQQAQAATMDAADAPAKPAKPAGPDFSNMPLPPEKKKEPEYDASSFSFDAPVDDSPKPPGGLTLDEGDATPAGDAPGATGTFGTKEEAVVALFAELEDLGHEADAMEVIEMVQALINDLGRVPTAAEISAKAKEYGG